MEDDSLATLPWVLSRIHGADESSVRVVLSACAGHAVLIVVGGLACERGTGAMLEAMWLYKSQGS